jgi:hypothetical protein
MGSKEAHEGLDMMPTRKANRDGLQQDKQSEEAVTSG